MGSETLSSSQIFFKDRKNEIKGPFTERQVQEWYRKKLFDGSFPFCFLREGEKPCNITPFLTLDELCSRNGIGAPFSPPSDVIPSEKIRAQSEQRLHCIEEKIRSLRVKCEEVLRVKERIEKMEEKVMGFSVSHSTKSSSAGAAESVPAASAAVEPEKPAAKAASGSLPVMAFLRSVNRNAITVYIELVKRIEEKKYTQCDFCDRCMFTAQQTFMHIASADHVANIHPDLRSFNDKLIQIIGAVRVELMFKQEAEREKSQQLKWSSMSLDDPELRPTKEFIKSLQSAITKTDPGFTKLSTADKYSGVAFALKKNDEKNDSVGMMLINDISKHIGNSKTRCLPCKVIFGNATEYYRHLLTYYHLNKVHASKSPFDVITMAVNVQRRLYRI